jgi:hypothetical protein
MNNLYLIIFSLELIIYVWAVWTAKLKNDNYFAISNKQIFEKCARNSGRISAILNVIILLFVGYWGLEQIYLTKKHFDMFLILVNILTINHLIHFYYISRNFKRQSLKIKFKQEKRGIFTYICITAFPLFVWYFNHLNAVVYIIILLHLYNVSYVFVMALYSKITVNAQITIHNKLGMFVTTAAWAFLMYRVFVEQILQNHLLF